MAKNPLFCDFGQKRGILGFRTPFWGPPARGFTSTPRAGSRGRDPGLREPPGLQDPSGVPGTVRRALRGPSRGSRPRPGGTGSPPPPRTGAEGRTGVDAREAAAGCAKLYYAMEVSSVHFRGLLFGYSTPCMARLFLLRDRRSQRRDPGGSPGPHGYSPGGDPLHPLRGLPRAWAARFPTPAPAGNRGAPARGVDVKPPRNRGPGEPRRG